MTSPPRNVGPNSMAGGFLIAAGAILGAGVGVFVQQPTAGLLIGAATGAGMAIAIWLIDRRR
ncbi:hypothetical protein ACFOKI_12180 [Sphingomonas qilianensis]|uniref:Uncharacterized protein n=1 Tax=Sphingomonas qilianensis TaxID=1736690 RepID=A0ABU9XNU9_9SPHN